TGGYASDLLSDVLAHAGEGSVWVTLHIHQNIVAVASHKDLAGIVLVQGRQPEKDTIAKAEEEGIPVLVSQLPAFELIGRLYQAGIRGVQED
ncbi:MAG TPA: serine kinase, partial [Nitrospirota bacterium]|nr:serine kinase [Nitrospirota bacterium]